MLSRYEKILKRNIRRVKEFKKNKEIKIIALESNTSEFALNLIERLNKKYNLNLKLDMTTYKNIEEISIEKESIAVIPLEATFLSYLIYTYTNEKRYLEIFKFEKNISFNISEFYISKYLNKEPKIFTSDYKLILDFIYDIMKKNEKYANSLPNFLLYLRKYY